MSKLFETITSKSLQCENRFVRSATWLGMANQDGSCTPKLVDTMTALAQGGVGLIMTGHAYVLKGGQASPWQIGCDADHVLPGLTEMTQAVHAVGGKIALQIAHGGIFASAELSGQTPLGASAMSTASETIGDAMTKDDIECTIHAFAAAASRAAQTGFDGVQIHAAHGYLLSQFLSPYFNKRTDEYGGSLENRARMLLRVVEAVHGAVKKDYPIFIKINSEDLLDGGFSHSEMMDVCIMLAHAGVDAIELSGGTTFAIRLGKLELSFIPVRNPGVYWQHAAEQYKAKINVPLMLVGGIRSLKTAETLMNSGVADYISLCRPLIREPDLVNRWKTDERKEADCISDNACGRAGHTGNGVRCVHLDT